MKNKNNIWLLVLAVFVIPFAAFGVVNWIEKKFNRLPVYGITKNKDGKKIEHVIPAFSFINQDSEIVSTESWNDKIIVADYFFTHCPTICPKMTNNLKKVQEKYYDDKEIEIFSFTVDPGRDNPARLKAFAERFGINNSKWTLLTGDKKELYKMARNGFMIAATDGDGGPDDFIHSEKLVLVDKHRRIRGYYSGTNSLDVELLLNDIKKLKHEK